MRDRTEYYRKRYLENKEIVKENSKRNYEKNKDSVLQYKKEHYQKNKETILLQQKESRRNKYNSDLNFRLISNYRNRLSHAVKGYDKSSTTRQLIGCSIECLKEHLEKQFVSGMSWDNYGQWHIDHIRPCASFDFNNADEQYECFHYTNLQPLWAEDNRKKSAIY